MLKTEWTQPNQQNYDLKDEAAAVKAELDRVKFNLAETEARLADTQKDLNRCKLSNVKHLLQNDWTELVARFRSDI